jgi:hypothetical protein
MSTETRARHRVTVEDLRHLATIDKRSLFADADTLIDTEDGITQVPFRVVEAVLDGRSKLASCRLLYHRSQFIEDGVITGASPKAADGHDLDARLTVLADGINEERDTTDTTEENR